MTAALGRLKKRGEFLAVAAANRRSIHPGVMLQAKIVGPASDDRHALIRVGFTATKKIGNAVKRNRARRRLRAAVAETMRGISTNADIVLVARQGTLDRPFSDLKSDIQGALHRLGITP